MKEKHPGITRTTNSAAGSHRRGPAAPPGSGSQTPTGDEGGDGLFREIVEKACDLIYRLDLEGRITYVNPATEALTGYQADTLQGTLLTDLVHEAYRSRLGDALASLAEVGTPPEVTEFPIITRGGEEVWLGQTTRRIERDGVVVALQGEARDVTEQRRLREALATSEQRLRAMVESLGDGLIVTDADDRVLYVNPAFEQITGYGAADLVGNRALELLGGAATGSDAGRRIADMPERFELRIRHCAGHWVDLRVIATALRDENGEPFALLGSVADISDQKRAERARDESEDRFRQLTETIHEAFWIATADHQIPLYVSPAYEDILGEPRERLTEGHTSLLDFVHPEDREQVEQATSADRLADGGFEVEFRVLRRDGEVRWLQSRGFGVRDADGRIDRIAGVVEDITESRAAHEAMRRSEASYRSLYNSLAELVYIQDQEGLFLNVNDAVVEAYGYAREELIGQSPVMLADPERLDAEELWRRLREAAAGRPQRFEFWGRRKDGTTFPKEVVLTRTEYFGHDAVMAVGRDISERKRAEAERERLAALSRENPNPVLECDASGSPLHLNPAAEAAVRDLGLEAVEKLLPENHLELVRHALERGEGTQNIEVVAAGRIFEWTYRPHTPGGVVHLFATEVTGRRLREDQLRHDALHDALTDLPNRMLFLERLEHVVQRIRRREGTLFAVLFLDLDRFKPINDGLGHQVGDELLVALAERLRGCVRGEDTVSRFGGDEFAILVESISDVADAVRVAERIQEALAAPLVLHGIEMPMSASIGICVGSSGDDQPHELLRNADVAMYRAKSGGPGRFEVFDRG